MDCSKDEWDCQQYRLRDSRPCLAWPYRRRQMCVFSLAGPSFSFLPACHLSSSFESPRHFAPSFQEHPERYEDPQHIEEDKVQPQVDWVVALQLGVSAQPFGREGHESAVQLSSRQQGSQEPESCLQVCFRFPRWYGRNLVNQVANIHCGWSRQSHSQDLEGDDGEIGSAPSMVRFCVFLPEARHWGGRIEGAIASVLVAE